MTIVHCFTHDLRLHDNPALTQACDVAQQIGEPLALLYCLSPKSLVLDTTDTVNESLSLVLGSHQHPLMGPHRWRFLRDSLQDLAQQCQQAGHQLMVALGSPDQVLSLAFIDALGVQQISVATPVGWLENKQWRQVPDGLPSINLQFTETHTLFCASEMPMSPDNLPDGFSRFRRQVEKQLDPSHITAPLPKPDLNTITAVDWHAIATDTAPIIIHDQKQDFEHAIKQYALNGTVSANNEHDANQGPHQVPLFYTQVLTDLSLFGDGMAALPANGGQDANRHHINRFGGGESVARQHISDYFASSAPSSYKQTRNDLYGWSASSKFSAWLAHGCISARTIISQLLDFEQANGANKSTYWLYFELLWREFFIWHARKYGKQLFLYPGVRFDHISDAPSWYDDPASLQAWCTGTINADGDTPIGLDLVNASMRELNATGYMTNRARQYVASSLVNELSQDWRCGARYFEYQLVDYEVGSNWGNWQYLGGVGVDSRGKRQFNLQKQAHQFDGNEAYRNLWLNEG